MSHVLPCATFARGLANGDAKDAHRERASVHPELKRDRIERACRQLASSQGEGFDVWRLHPSGRTKLL